MTWIDAFLCFATFITSFTVVYLSVSIIRARRRWRDFRTATIDEIQESIDTWDQWGYDILRKEFVFFTCWYMGEDGKPLYKPKEWCKGNFATFIEILKKGNNHEKYTRHNSWH